MAFTTFAFAEDIDLAGATANIAAEPDNHLFTQGDDIRVPSLNNLLVAMGGLGSGGDGFIRLEAPSIRDDNRLVISPLNHLADSDCEPSDPIAIYDVSNNPRPFVTDEILQCKADSDTSAASFQWLVCWFGDGRPTPVSGDVITVRTTNTSTLTARAWTQVSLTFADSLQVGRYQVVGMRAHSASLVAARLVFKPGTWRPGCPGVDSQATMDYSLFRMGRLGVWGEFHSTQPPDVECLADAADSALTVDLDLIRVSAG